MCTHPSFFVVLFEPITENIAPPICKKRTLPFNKSFFDSSVIGQRDIDERGAGKVLPGRGGRHAAG